MSIGSTLKHVLGFVAGILIPGASEKTTNLTHSIQQHIADLYGPAAAAMAKELKLDTSLTGARKVFAIRDALVATAKRDGFKGDVKVFGHLALDVAQAAFLKEEPNIGADIVALASALTANPLVLVATNLVSEVVQTAADHLMPAKPIAQAA